MAYNFTFPMPTNTLIWGDANSMYAYAQGRTAATDSYIAQLGTAASQLAPPIISPSAIAVSRDSARAIHIQSSATATALSASSAHCPNGPSC